MPSLRTVAGQPSWRIASDRVEAFVTQMGGQIGPVTFDRKRRRIRPFSVAPWAEERLDPSTPAIIRALRGDFFCLPFGANATPWRGERHPIHGETANERWRFESLDDGKDGPTLHLSLRTKVRTGRVDKFITLAEDHDAIYQRHVISGMSGPMCLGHHAMLKFPDEPGSGVITTSRFVHGQVFPEPVELPENRGYSILKPGATFKSLSKVPTITGETADLSLYPARRGFEDIAMLVADETLPFAWTAVTFPRQGFAWIALKDPRVLRSTVMWHSNAGRHYAPWNGRHVGVLGLEEVTANFHRGLAESVRLNPLSRRGTQTKLDLRRDRALTVNYIIAVVSTPRSFARVDSIEATTGGVEIRGGTAKIRCPIRTQFLRPA